MKEEYQALNFQKSKTIKHLKILLRCRNQRTGSFCRKTCDRFSLTTIKKKKRMTQRFFPATVAVGFGFTVFKKFLRAKSFWLSFQHGFPTLVLIVARCLLVAYVLVTIFWLVILSFVTEGFLVASCLVDCSLVIIVLLIPEVMLNFHLTPLSIVNNGYFKHSNLVWFQWCNGWSFRQSRISSRWWTILSTG